MRLLEQKYSIMTRKGWLDDTLILLERSTTYTVFRELRGCGDVNDVFFFVGTYDILAP